MKPTRIVIIKAEQPEMQNVNDLLQWFGGSLGLFSMRDRDRSCFRVFIVLLKSGKKERGKAVSGVSSEEIAEVTSLSRGTVVYHLNKLMEAGLVREAKKKYYLEADTLEGLAEKLRMDAEIALENLKRLGREIDGKMKRK
jgi:DNA-binding transcriptional ArsR family regulator